jgi:hypothetical protein
VAPRAAPHTAQFPQFAADGGSVLYLGYTYEAGFGVWRAARDGSGAEQLRAGTHAGESFCPGVAGDGAGARVVHGGPFDPGLAWSPDGVWLLGHRMPGPLVLVRVVDGLEIPLPYATELWQPSWR